MNDWRKPCEHGRYVQHGGSSASQPYCPGGSSVTAADLEGEKVWWCEEHLNTGEGRDLGCWKSDLITANKGACFMVERLLIPIPDPIAAE